MKLALTDKNCPQISEQGKIRKHNKQRSAFIVNLIVQCSSCNSEIHSRLNRSPSTAALRRSRFPLTSPCADCSRGSSTGSSWAVSLAAQLTSSRYSDCRGLLKRLVLFDFFAWTLTSAPRFCPSLLVRIRSTLPNFQWDLGCPSSWTKTRSPTETKLDPVALLTRQWAFLSSSRYSALHLFQK